MALGRRILLTSSLIIFLWMCVGIFVFRTSFQFTNDSSDKLLSPKSPEQELQSCKSSHKKLSPGFWRRINLHKKQIPQSVKESLSAINVESISVPIQGSKVHYIHAKPKELKSDISVLLLHGQSFTSRNWDEIGTIQTLAALGYHTIAVDLPGFGETPSFPDLDKTLFLDELITALNVKKPVLISPSMSGTFSLKYLIEHQEKLGGFIPVAPVRTSILSDACKDKVDDSIEMAVNEDCLRIMHYLDSRKLNLNCIKVPSLIVWGERDKALNSAKLCLLPESQGAEIPEGKHAAYLSNPGLWHKLLYNFLSALNETRACR